WHTGTFGQFEVSRIGPQDSRGATLGDFDNDGDNDVFVCNYGRNYIWRNDGSRNFTSVVVPFGRKDDSRGAAVADFDGDGNLDIYVCSKHSDTLLLGNGDCTFEDKTKTNLPHEDVTSWRAVAFDYDGDGDLDIFVSKWGQNRLLRNDGNGRFDYENNIPVDRSNSRDVAHFVRGGVHYLLVGNRGSLCRLYRVYEKRLFDVTAINLPIPADFTYGVAVGDVNGDGIPDAYIANDGYDVLLFGRP
ncbi:MAG: VCBS repeat-containing protein, partial [Planctomycetota bacterium]|nr:VCBS repeat-containing protein [Planctomycetota bacterium]